MPQIKPATMAPAPADPARSTPTPMPILSTATITSLPATPSQPVTPLQADERLGDFVPVGSLRFTPHSYTCFARDYSTDTEEEETPSQAVITPPPCSGQRSEPIYEACMRLERLQQPPPAAASTRLSRRFLFQNREKFNIVSSSNNNNSDDNRNNHVSNAITPTSLSAAAAAMFSATAPQMAQLNRKWTNLNRRRRRRNSSSGDSKELDRLVLQSVDWDENDIY